MTARPAEPPLTSVRWIVRLPICRDRKEPYYGCQTEYERVVVVGLIRKTLRVATGGTVAARSRKQRTQAQILAARQGKSEQEIAAAGGRGFDFENQQKAAQRARGKRQAAAGSEAGLH